MNEWQVTYVYGENDNPGEGTIYVKGDDIGDALDEAEKELGHTPFIVSIEIHDD